MSPFIVPKPDDALAGYNFMRKIYTRRIYPNVEGIRNSIRVLTLTNEKFGRFALGYLAYKKPHLPLL